MFALVDCNTFYASCEQIYNPAVRGKPIVVLSNNDGCIISRNAEAKALNIPGLVPFYQVKTMIERNNIHIFSSNYELYGDISARVMKLLEPYATEIEVYSIDEAFLDLHCTDYKSHAKAIKNMLFKEAGMPVCVGIAPTKTLSKLANHAAKKMQTLEGVCVLDQANKWEWLLKRVATNEIWGIGKQISNKLHGLGIHNALELAQANPKILRRHFSVVLERTVRELNGEPCLNLDTEPVPRKEIISTRSFSYKVTELSELQQAVSLYASRACEKLRSQNGLTANLWIYLEISGQQGGLFKRHKMIQLPYLTNDTRQIASQASAAISEIYQAGMRYKKCGIGLLDVRTKKYEQQDLFAPRQSAQSRKVMKVLDQVNRRYGKHSMHLANTGIHPQWTMKRDYMSPAYTTRWKDIPLIRC